MYETYGSKHYFPLGESLPLFFSDWSEQCSWSGEEPYIWRGENNIWNSIESGGAVSFTGGSRLEIPQLPESFQIHTNFSHLPFSGFWTQTSWDVITLRHVKIVVLSWIEFYRPLSYSSPLFCKGSKEMVWKTAMRAFLNPSLIILKIEKCFRVNEIFFTDIQSCEQIPILFLNIWIEPTYITLPP